MLRGFLNNARDFPDHPAIIMKNEVYTYSELLNLAYRISIQLTSSDTDDENLIGVYTDNSIYTYASIIAILFKGCGFVPINKKFPQDKLTNIIKSSGIKRLLCNSSSISDLQSLAKETEVELIVNDQHNQAYPVDLDNYKTREESSIAYILFTSGSTGIPKGIGITHSNFSAFIRAMNHSGLYDFKCSDRILQIFELSFDVSIACIFIAWEAGACLVPVPTEELVFIKALEIIKEHQVTVISMAPSALAYMKQLKLLEEFNFPHVRYTFFTGEALPYNLAVAWKKVAENSIIENAYGPTEVTVWSSMYRFNDQTSEEVINGLAPIGKVLPGLKYNISDDQLNPVKRGNFGELLLYGSQVANGYWQNTSKTTSVFIKMNPGQFPGYWYRTGDIVVENEKGNIVYINRKDNQVQINGFRVELGEIEFRIREYIKKDAVVVLPYENKNNTLTLIAFIECLGDEVKDLKHHLISTLPSYMVPKKFYSVDTMPLNNSGKIDRKILLKIHAED